ncbi:MAG: Hsp33 family molecular chaperone HslO [Clostridium sp.]|nr:Hsp33 family molecular chaperone HslO [Clostridium sp.]MCM1398274.1 Hsp33 family molecular chaperone HslO [Clostridium sp.]MCM1459062.1 Hsp33 family molecular chaperone HslO [Bacteroides sp.]
MSDYIVRGMAAGNQVRFFACCSTETVEKARITHNTSPVVTNALGRLLTGGVLMGAMCKNDTDTLTIRVECQGPLHGMLVTADSKGNVKGYVSEADVMLPAKDVAKAIDLGVMSVIKDIGMKEPYVGQTHLVSSEIAEDLTYYFVTSEQIPSSVALGVLLDDTAAVRVAGGFIIQLMPFAKDEIITFLEERLKDFSFTAMLENGMSVEKIIAAIFEGHDVAITDTLPCSYMCDCSKERVEKAVISLGRKEIADMIDEGKPIEVVCDFCRTKYTFSPDELLKLLTTQQNR